MHGGGGGLLAQGLKANTLICLVVTAKCYGRKKSRVVYSISFSTVTFLNLGFVLCIAKYMYRTLSVGLEYTLCALPKFADPGPLD